MTISFNKPNTSTLEASKRKKLSSLISKMNDYRNQLCSNTFKKHYEYCPPEEVI
jgi:hypothetical protein